MTHDMRKPDTTDGEPDRLDLRGLKCPLPVLRTRRRLETGRPGDLVLVETTDPMSAIDIPHLCQTEGHRLIAMERDGGVIRFRIEAGRPGGAASAAGASPRADDRPSAPARPAMPDQPNVPEKPEM